MSSHMDIIVPFLGESVLEATLSSWFKKEGEFVKTDEILGELETDKITVEISAPGSGIIDKIIVKEGETIKVGHVLGVIKEGNQETNLIALRPDEPRLSPAARKIVAEKNLKILPQKEGPILKEDLLEIQNPSMEENNHSKENNKKVPLSPLRQKIAERLKYAQNTAAILTTFNEIDMFPIQNLRAQYQEEFKKKHTVKLGFMSFFVKACVIALKEFPILNAFIENKEVIYHNFCDIGVAISAPQGLVVPILRNVEKMSFKDIEHNILSFSEKARENRLSLADLQGGTFTISNGGVFGSLFSTPILNPPQSAILGMHRIQDKPVVLNKKIVIRPMMYTALSYDHRLIDGKEAVSFLVRIKELLEAPERFILEI